MTESPVLPGDEERSPMRTNVPRRKWGRFVAAACVLLMTAIVLLVIRSRNTGPLSHYARGRAALAAVDRDTVMRESELLVRTPGYEPYGWLLKGLQLTRQGKLDEAIVYLGKAAEQDSLMVEASTAAAQCLYMSGLYLQAIDAAQRALQRDEHCLDARRWLAAAYYDLGALSHAVVELRRISSEAPRDPQPDRLLGLIAKDGEHYTDAIEYYAEALRRDPRHRDLDKILVELADCQIKLGRFADALKSLQESEPSAAVLTLEAECHSGLGKIDDAHARLRDALQRDPRYVPAQLVQGKLLLDQGQAEEAARILTSAALLEPRNSQIHFQLSQALRQTGQTEQADNALSRMREIQTLEREFTDLHETAASQPDDPDVRYRIGELARELDKPKLARIWFQAALALDPRHTKARAALRQLDQSEQPPR